MRACCVAWKPEYLKQVGERPGAAGR
jgi:hypothetical protein